MVSIQLNNLNTIIEAIIKKEKVAATLLQDMQVVKEEIATILYKNVGQYLEIFGFEIRERDPVIENR